MASAGFVAPPPLPEPLPDPEPLPEPPPPPDEDEDDATTGFLDADADADVDVVESVDVSGIWEYVGVDTLFWLLRVAVEKYTSH